MVIWSGDKVAGSDPALPIHVNFLLDEFKNIGAIPNFLNYLATVRKYRIGLHIIIQDIGQIKTMYKEQEHETLLANVDTTIFLGSILPEDKEYIQKMLGKTTIKQRSTSDSKTGQNISYTPTEVPLMSLDEISAINSPNDNRDDCIVIVRDCDPIVGRKLLLNEHCRAKLVDEAQKIINIELFWRNNNESQIEVKMKGE
jgi:type IV secretion system protein VirD4